MRRRRPRALVGWRRPPAVTAATGSRKAGFCFAGGELVRLESRDSGSATGAPDASLNLLAGRADYCRTAAYARLCACPGRSCHPGQRSHPLIPPHVVASTSLVLRLAVRPVQVNFAARGGGPSEAGSSRRANTTNVSVSAVKSVRADSDDSWPSRKSAPVRYTLVGATRAPNQPKTCRNCVSTAR